MYILPHQNTWAAEFAFEKERIRRATGSSLRLFHIGSTAVKGLCAKDCIDILGEVDDLDRVSDMTGSLIDLGYLYKGAYGIEGREYFSKPKRKVHLHIFQKSDPNIERHLRFVQEMRSNPNLIAELNTLKQKLHHKYPKNKDQYQSEKSVFYDKFNF